MYNILLYCRDRVELLTFPRGDIREIIFITLQVERKRQKQRRRSMQNRDF